MSSLSTPTTKRNWHVAFARGGMALTGFSGLPVLNAKTSKELQPNTRSAGLRPGCPQSASMLGPLLPPSTLQSASTRRTASGNAAGFHSGTLISPRSETTQLMACANWMPGFEMSPPQLPEWCAPARDSMLSSKLMQPLEPRKMVGRSALSLGPSEAISKSALSKFACSWQKSRSPGEPVSSPISMRYLALKPKLPLCAKTQASACRLTEC